VRISSGVHSRDESYRICVVARPLGSKVTTWTIVFPSLRTKRGLLDDFFVYKSEELTRQ
jgi:hypothetical protein